MMAATALGADEELGEFEDEEPGELEDALQQGALNTGTQAAQGLPGNGCNNENTRLGSFQASSRTRELSRDGKPKKKGIKKPPPVRINLSACKYEVLRIVSNKLGWREVGDEDDWELYWTDTSVSIERIIRLQRTQKINHFNGMLEICRKKSMARNLSKMAKMFPTHYDFFPKTFTLPNDVQELLVDAKARGKKQVYIFKPDAGCQGKGIRLCQGGKEENMVKLYKEMEALQQINVVAQHYLDRPLLVNGYKFDMRIYTLVLSCDPLRVFIFYEGLARFCTVKYTKPKSDNLSVAFMHLTNYAVNKHNENFVAGTVNDDGTEDSSKWTLKQLSDHLRSEGHDWNVIWQRIQQLIVKSLISIQPILRNNYRSVLPPDNDGFSCFEILGYDIMLDADLQPWLIEVNHSPSFNIDSPLDLAIKEELITQTIDLVRVDPKLIAKAKKADKKAAAGRLLEPLQKKKPPGTAGNAAPDKGASAAAGSDCTAAGSKQQQASCSATVTVKTAAASPAKDGADGSATSRAVPGAATLTAAALPGGGGGGGGICAEDSQQSSLSKPKSWEEYEAIRADALQRREKWEDKHSGGFTRIYPVDDKTLQGLYEELLRAASELYQSNYQGKAKRALDALSEDKKSRANKDEQLSEAAKAEKARQRAIRDKLAQQALERRIRREAEKAMQAQAAYSSPLCMQGYEGSPATGVYHPFHHLQHPQSATSPSMILHNGQYYYLAGKGLNGTGGVDSGGVYGQQGNSSEVWGESRGDSPASSRPMSAKSVTEKHTVSSRLCAANNNDSSGTDLPHALSTPTPSSMAAAYVLVPAQPASAGSNNHASMGNAHAVGLYTSSNNTASILTHADTLNNTQGALPPGTFRISSAARHPHSAGPGGVSLSLPKTSASAQFGSVCGAVSGLQERSKGISNTPQHPHQQQHQQQHSEGVHTKRTCESVIPACNTHSSSCGSKDNKDTVANRSPGQQPATGGQDVGSDARPPRSCNASPSQPSQACITTTQSITCNAQVDVSKIDVSCTERDPHIIQRPVSATTFETCNNATTNNQAQQTCTTPDTARHTKHVSEIGASTSAYDRVSAESGSVGEGPVGVTSRPAVMPHKSVETITAGTHTCSETVRPRCMFDTNTTTMTTMTVGSTTVLLAGSRSAVSSQLRRSISSIPQPTDALLIDNTYNTLSAAASSTPTWKRPSSTGVVNHKGPAAGSNVVHITSGVGSGQWRSTDLLARYCTPSTASSNTTAADSSSNQIDRYAEGTWQTKDGRCVPGSMQHPDDLSDQRSDHRSPGVSPPSPHAHALHHSTVMTPDPRHANANSSDTSIATTGGGVGSSNAGGSSSSKPNGRESCPSPLPIGKAVLGIEQLQRHQATHANNKTLHNSATSGTAAVTQQLSLQNKLSPQCGAQVATVVAHGSFPSPSGNSITRAGTPVPYEGKLVQAQGTAGMLSSTHINQAPGALLTGGAVSTGSHVMAPGTTVAKPILFGPSLANNNFMNFTTPYTTQQQQQMSGAADAAGSRAVTPPVEGVSSARSRRAPVPAATLLRSSVNLGGPVHVPLSPQSANLFGGTLQLAESSPMSHLWPSVSEAAAQGGGEGVKAPLSQHQHGFLIKALTGPTARTFTKSPSMSAGFVYSLPPRSSRQDSSSTAGSGRLGKKVSYPIEAVDDQGPVLSVSGTKVA